MYAVIMAGGKGTRLSSVTNNEIPKPMVKLDGKPILEYQVECLRKNGINDFIFIIGHLGSVIENYFMDGSQLDIRIQYIYEKEPLGTAGSLYYLKEYLEEDFLLVFGDLIFDIDTRRFEKFHKKHDAICTLLVHPNTHPYDSDLIVLNKDSKAVGYVSKKDSKKKDYYNLVNSGLYIMSPVLLDKLSTLKKMDIEKDILFPMILNGDRIYGYQSSEYVKDVGTPERLATTEKDLIDGIVASKNLSRKQKCIFLDRDGTINKYVGLVDGPEQIELEDYVIEAIKRLNQSEYICIIVTNQPVVARGLCSIEDVDLIHKRLETLLGNAGAYVDKIVFCPHHPDRGYAGENPMYKVECNCRKPKTGMIDECRKAFNIDLDKSWIIGDTTSDIQCGINAGVNTALVLTGVAGQDKKYDVQPNIKCDNIYEIVNRIVGGKDEERLCKTKDNKK